MRVTAETKQAIADMAIASRYEIENKDGKTILTAGDDVSIASGVKAVEGFVKRLIRSNGAVASNNDDGLRLTPIGKRLLGKISSEAVHKAEKYPFHQFNPYFELFVNSLQEHGLIGERQEYSLRQLSYDSLAEKLNSVAECIRRSGTSKSFIARKNSYHRSSNKNYRELNLYVNELFNKYSRVLVVRVDLSYEKSFGKTMADLGYRKVKEDRVNLFRNARSNSLFDHLVGYAWKLEYGIDKGFHYHMLFFFDGSKRHSDIWIAQGIGEYWANKVTGGAGRYYNCNAVKQDYKYPGIGMIKYDDCVLREGLGKVMLYMTKVDYFMKLVLPGRDRAFGKGHMPSCITGRLGRPRSNR